MSDIRNLLPFIQAVRCGSFIAAAERLRVTPPAISKSIAKLERELGVRLFNRTTRKLHLTHEGKLFFQRISPLLDAVDAAVSEVTQSPKRAQGLVRVATTATFGRYCLLPTLAEFFRRYPDIELDVSFTEAPPNLVADGFDVSIQYLPASATTHVSRVLCDYPIVLVASPDYLKRKGSPARPEDLQHHDLICVRLPQRRSVIRLKPRSKKMRRSQADNAGFVLDMKGPLTIANQVDANLIAALYGTGITLSSLPVVLPYLRTGRLKLVLPEYAVSGNDNDDDVPHIYIHYPHRRHLPVKVKAFVEYLAERFRADKKMNALLDRYAS